MRRLLVALIFPLLLAAQQAAFVHTLEHFSTRAAADGASHPQPAPDERFCEKCFAFAPLGSAANTTLPLLVFAADAGESIEFPLASARAADLLAPRSRGPPSFL